MIFCCASGLVFLTLRGYPRLRLRGAGVGLGFGFGLLVFALASALCLFAGIRAMPSCFKRRPYAGRHLLFFAAAKKSRQKKAANTANPSSCMRAPNRSYASHGSVLVRVRCQRSLCTPHPLPAPALRHAVPDIPPPPRWQTVCRLSRHTRTTPD